MMKSCQQYYCIDIYIYIYIYQWLHCGWQNGGFDLFLDTYKIIQQSIITVKKPNALPKANYAAFSMKKSRI